MADDSIGGIADRKTQARKLFDETASERQEVREYALRNPKRPWRAEKDVDRLARFEKRRGGAEAVRGDTVDFQPVVFLSEGFRASDPVAYVRGPRAAGSGFLISDRLFITNQHVLQDKRDAAGAEIEFHFQTDKDGYSLGRTVFKLDPDAFFLSSPEVGGLDYVVVAVGARVSGEAEIGDFSCCPLGDQDDKHAVGMNVNIIQHPDQRPKAVVLRNNLLTSRTEDALLYESDTEVGSSGSPVFNDAWSVIALHHYGEPFLARAGDMDLDRNANEGIRASSIVRDLKRQRDTLDEAQRDLLDHALALGASAKAPQEKRLVLHRESASVVPVVQKDTAAKRDRAVSRNSVVKEAKVMDETSNGQVLKFTIPIEITVRVGGEPSVGEGRADSPRRISIVSPRSAEKAIVDFDYSTRKGYDPGFLGVDVPLPVASKSLIAPLKSDQPQAADGELKYEHFSVKLHRARRLALFTATNIKPSKYVNIDRDTGLPSDNAEGSERWWPDSRIDEKYLVMQDFYSSWSNYFDRGHLTRRTDPTWGSDKVAIRANGDTFHFTNCTPQHFRFNQSTKYWQGVERYVLEHGALESNKQITVFQGPVLSNEYADADDVRVPLEFWKIAIWVGKNGLRASGFRVSQEKLLDEERRGVKRDTDDIEVSQFRASIESLEKLTGLQFGDDVKAGDTFKDKNVAVGAEAVPVKRITTWEDIL